MEGSMKHNTISAIRVLLIALAFSAALISCGKMGTAVILWPPENSQWQPGDRVVVKDESLLRNTYIVKVPNQRRIMEEIDKWRLRLFKREADTIELTNAFSEWRNVYAECLYQGLPMREEASNLANQIYRLREKEIIKVLAREPGPVQVGNLEGYWYKVLAEGGVEGYVFDYHLRVVRREGHSTTVLNAKEAGDVTLENFLKSVWRPKIFSVMLERRQIDMSLFRGEYGFFINRDTQTLSINLPEQRLSEKWTEIVPAGFQPL